MYNMKSILHETGKRWFSHIAFRLIFCLVFYSHSALPINASSNCGISATNIFIAIGSNDIKSIKCLLETDIDLNKIGPHGHTALWETVLDERHSVALLLLQNGADKNRSGDDILLNLIISFQPERDVDYNEGFVRLFEEIIPNNSDINGRFINSLFGMDLHYMLALVSSVCESPNTLSVLHVNRLAEAIPTNRLLLDSSDLAAIGHIKAAVQLGIYQQSCVDRMLQNIIHN